MAGGLADTKPHASLDDFVEDLAVPHRAQRARLHLMLVGAEGVDALRRGLHHPNARVRVGCCVILDHHLEESCIPSLIENLTHDDAEVRAWAAHALACDRCKEGSCRPGEDQIVPMALAMLRDDPDHRVREKLVGVLGPAVHRRSDVLIALESTKTEDPHPMVRKLAGWWVPGGSRYERTLPREQRTRR